MDPLLSYIKSLLEKYPKTKWEVRETRHLQCHPGTRYVFMGKEIAPTQPNVLDVFRIIRTGNENVSEISWFMGTIAIEDDKVVVWGRCAVGIHNPRHAVIDMTEEDSMERLKGAVHKAMTGEEMAIKKNAHEVIKECQLPYPKQGCGDDSCEHNELFDCKLPEKDFLACDQRTGPEGGIIGPKKDE